MLLHVPKSVTRQDFQAISVTLANTRRNMQTIGPRDSQEPEPREYVQIRLSALESPQTAAY